MKKTEYQTTITCPYHKDQFINSICIDNMCNDKLLCHACIKYNQDHNYISLPQFCNNLIEYTNLVDTSSSLFKPEIQQVINGKDMNQKLQQFMIQANQAQSEIEQSHNEQFNVLFDHFTKNVNETFQAEKLKIITAYKKTQDECFSQQTLLNKDFKDRACHLILSSVKKDNYLNMNANIRKLHQGQLELAFAKEQKAKETSQLQNAQSQKTNLKTEPDYEDDDNDQDDDNENNKKQKYKNRFLIKSDYQKLRKQNSLAALKNLSLSTDKHVNSEENQHQLSIFSNNSQNNNNNNSLPRQAFTPKGQNQQSKSANYTFSSSITKSGFSNPNYQKRNSTLLDDIIFQSDLSKQIVDAININDTTIITGSTNGEITSWFHKTHSIEKAWTVRGHSQMGKLSNYLPSSNVFFSTGLSDSKTKKVQVKLWVLQQNNNFIELVEFQDLHKVGIKYLIPYNDYSVQRSLTNINTEQENQNSEQQDSYRQTNNNNSKIKNIIYLVTLGEDNFLKIWAIQYMSAQQMYSSNCIQKLGQIGVISKSVNKIVLSEQEQLYFYMQNTVYKIALIENQLKKEGELHVNLQSQSDELIDIILKKNCDKIILVSKHGKVFIYSLQLNTTFKKFDIFQKLLNINPHLLADKEDQIVKCFNHFQDLNKFFIVLKEKEIYSLLFYDCLQDCIVGRKQFDSDNNNVGEFLLFQDESFLVIENGNKIKLYQPFWK